MANQAKAKVFWSGQLLHVISNPDVSANIPQDTQPLRGMDPSDEPYGWQVGQKPDFTITFTAPVMDGSQEVDWATAAANLEHGKLQIEQGSTGMVSIYDCVVTGCEPKVDEGRNVTWNVTLRASTRRRIG